jgi:GH15 family glucan-1,4-alpha-glucosidase
MGQSSILARVSGIGIIGSCGPRWTQRHGRVASCDHGVGHSCVRVGDSMGKGRWRVLLEDYGLIGDLESAALVGRNGAIDWLCLPRFDSASCFSALLGDEQHGRWLLAPAGEAKATARRYRPKTLVLETEFETGDGAVRVIDFMPRRGSGPPRVMRIVEGLRGRVPMRMELSLRPGYATIRPWVERASDGSSREPTTREDPDGRCND